MQEIDMQEIFESLTDQIYKIIDTEKVALVKELNDVSIYLKENKKKIIQIYKSEINTLEIVLVILFREELSTAGFHEYQINVEKKNEQYYIENNKKTNSKLINNQECKDVNEVCNILIELLNERLQLLHNL